MWDGCRSLEIKHFSFNEPSSKMFNHIFNDKPCDTTQLIVPEHISLKEYRIISIIVSLIASFGTEIKEQKLINFHEI